MTIENEGQHFSFSKQTKINQCCSSYCLDDYLLTADGFEHANFTHTFGISICLFFSFEFDLLFYPFLKYFSKFSHTFISFQYLFFFFQFQRRHATFYLAKIRLDTKNRYELIR